MSIKSAQIYKFFPDHVLKDEKFIYFCTKYSITQLIITLN